MPDGSDRYLQQPRATQLPCSGALWARWFSSVAVRGLGAVCSVAQQCRFELARLEIGRTACAPPATAAATLCCRQLCLPVCAGLDAGSRAPAASPPGKSVVSVLSNYRWPLWHSSIPPGPLPAAANVAPVTPATAAAPLASRQTALCRDNIAPEQGSTDKYVQTQAVAIIDSGSQLPSPAAPQHLPCQWCSSCRRLWPRRWPAAALASQAATPNLAGPVGGRWDAGEGEACMGGQSCGGSMPFGIAEGPRRPQGPSGSGSQHSAENSVLLRKAGGAPLQHQRQAHCACLCCCGHGVAHKLGRPPRVLLTSPGHSRQLVLWHRRNHAARQLRQHSAVCLCEAGGAQGPGRQLNASGG